MISFQNINFCNIYLYNLNFRHIYKYLNKANRVFIEWIDQDPSAGFGSSAGLSSAFGSSAGLASVFGSSLVGL